jgi:hypothetical protein
MLAAQLPPQTTKQTSFPHHRELSMPGEKWHEQFLFSFTFLQHPQQPPFPFLGCGRPMREIRPKIDLFAQKIRILALHFSPYPNFRPFGNTDKKSRIAFSFSTRANRNEVPKYLGRVLTFLFRRRRQSRASGCSSSGHFRFRQPSPQPLSPTRPLVPSNRCVATNKKFKPSQKRQKREKTGVPSLIKGRRCSP